MRSDSYTCVSTTAADGPRTPALPVITAFVCVNCARPPVAPTSAGRGQPTVPQFKWPEPVRQILVPCTGRLQPEHVLKAFESGSNLVCAVACQEDNCHYLEGSKRCARRVAYIRSVLDEIGLGGERLLLFHLPGTAAEDMAVASGKPLPKASNGLDTRLEVVRSAVKQALQDLPSNPLHEAPLVESDWDSPPELEISDDNNQE